jgi:TonB family protein
MNVEFRTIPYPYPDHPQGEDAQSGTAHALLRGIRKQFTARALRQREEILRSVLSLLEPVLDHQETILYLACGSPKPTWVQSLLLNDTGYAGTKSGLLFTNQRLLELRLHSNGKKPDGRIRSIPWPGVVQAQINERTLEIRLKEEKPCVWVVETPQDKEELQHLLPRIAEHLIPQRVSESVAEPREFCPSCRTEVLGPGAPCPGCRQFPLSPWLAAGLSLAFPGAGLLYAGSAKLALSALVAEMVPYVLVATHLDVFRTHGVPWLIWAMVLVVLSIRAQAMYCARLMTRRGAREPMERRVRWRRFLVGAVLATVLAGVGVATVSRRATARVDGDLLAAMISEGRDAQVLAVLTGDKIRVLLDGEEHLVRLIGVDVPEIDSANEEVASSGEQARSFTRGYLLDTFSMKETFRDLEGVARKNGIGIWKTQHREPLDLSDPPVTGTEFGGVSFPVLIEGSTILPVYPEEGRRQGVSGQVVLEALVSVDGSLRVTRVLQTPAENMGFEDAAIKAAEQWRYKPAMKDGKPVDVYFTIVLEFALK